MQTRGVSGELSGPFYELLLLENGEVGEEPDCSCYQLED